MSQRKEDEKKRKKKQEAQIEAFLLSMLEKSMKYAAQVLLHIKISLNIKNIAP